MDYWVPELRLSMYCPPETEFVERFGGLPWGLPKGRRPICPDCKKPFALLVQLEHSERLNLGRPGRRLYVFQCGTSPQGCGAILENGTAIVLEPEDKIDLRPAPLSKAEKWFVPIRIIGWTPRHESLSEEMHLRVLNLSPTDLDLPLAVHDIVSGDTKVGGTPAWGNGFPPFRRSQRWRFLFQMQDTLDAVGPLPTADELGCRVIDYTHQPVTPGTPVPQKKPARVTSASLWAIIMERNGEHSRYAISVGNFGEGRAYVFVRRLNTKHPEIQFQWMRY